jgi:glycosyltransferase involved in cell wall biosynthesis
VETQIFQWIKGLQERGHVCTVLADRCDDSLKEEEVYKGIPIKRLPFDRMIAKLDPQAIRPIREYLESIVREFQPDVIHLNVCVGWGALAFLLFRSLFPMPIVSTIHSSFFWDGKSIPLIEKFFSAVDQICCVSNSILQEMETRLPSFKDRYRVIHNGLSMPTIAPSPLPFSPPTLLLLGRLRPEKGFDTALKSFSLLRESGLDAKLLIAGEGGQLSLLETLVCELGLTDCAEFVGKVAGEEIPSLINRATLVVVPSHFEAFGLVALEAMQMARPVIASRVGGLSELISDGETGLLIPPRDPVTLYSTMRDLLTQPEKAIQMGVQGRKRAAEFTLDQNMMQYEQLYANLVGIT